MHTQIFIHACAYMRICTSTHVYMCKRANTHMVQIPYKHNIHGQTLTRAYIYITSIHTYKIHNTYIHAYIHACIHTYIHTYIHACIQGRTLRKVEERKTEEAPRPSDAPKDMAAIVHERLNKMHKVMRVDSSDDDDDDGWSSDD